VLTRGKNSIRFHLSASGQHMLLGLGIILYCIYPFSVPGWEDRFQRQELRFRHVGVIFSIYIAYWVMVFTLWWHARKHPAIFHVLRLGFSPPQGVNVGEPQLISGRWQEDSEARIVRLAFKFLINFVLVVLWYAFRYDSEGTMNPGWTTVFG
jgi:hypothetical protein